MDETGFDDWLDVVTASDANALALAGGAANDQAEAQLRALLSHHDKHFGGGLYGLSRMHFKRARQCHDVELGAAHLAAHRHYNRKAADLSAELDGLLATLGDSHDVGLAVADRVLAASKELGGEGGMDLVALGCALEALREAGLKPGARLLLEPALELETAHDASLMELIELLGLPISAGDCLMVNAFWLLDTLVWDAGR